MNQGIIQAIDFEKGLGYIRDERGEEIMLITKGLEGVLGQQMPVQYEVRQTRVGLIAINIQPVGSFA